MPTIIAHPTYNICTKWFLVAAIYNFLTNLLTVPTERWCQGVVRRASSRVYSNNTTGSEIQDVLPDYTNSTILSITSEGSGNILSENADDDSTIIVILQEDAPNSRTSFDTTNSRVSFDTPFFRPEQAKYVTALVRSKNVIELQASWNMESVLEVLGTHSDKGIGGNGEDLRIRTKAFGCNNYPMMSFVLLKKFISHYISRSRNDVVLYVSFFLSFGVRVCSHQQGWKEGRYMLLIAFVYSLLSSVLDFGVEKYLDGTTTRLFECSSVVVLRNGGEQLIRVFQIVVGDIIVLKPGQEIPADGLLIHHEQQLSVIEWDPVSNSYSKSVDINHSTNPFLFSGSTVITTGTAKMVVTAVGTNTKMWKVRAAASINHTTKLQDHVQTLSRKMKWVTYAVSLVVLIVMLGQYFTGTSRDNQGRPEFDVGKIKVGTVLYMVTRIILFTVTIQLALLSESYLWVVKICQGYNIRKMASHGIFVRNFSALEKMGSLTSLVVTDRTGELIDLTHLSDQFGNFGVKVEAHMQENLSSGDLHGGSGDSIVLTTLETLKQGGDAVAILTLDDDENVHTLALEQADVRVFMFSGSTDADQKHSITKAGSYDAYILNSDEFPSPVIKLFTWKRGILDNTRKLIHFQLTAGVVSLLNGFIYVVTQRQTPATDNRLVYSLLQLVWLNLVLGLLAAVAFSKEEVELQTRGVDNNEPLIYGFMCRNIAAQVVYQTAVIQVLQFKGESIFGVDNMGNDSMIFMVLFFCQVINMINARKVEEKNVFKGIERNRVFIVIVVGILVMQMVFVEILHKVVEIEGLGWKQKMECFGLSFGSLVVGVVVKLFPFPK